MDKYFCNPCGYTYDPEKGDPEHGIAPGTAFTDLPDNWVCPVCGIDKSMFGNTLSYNLPEEKQIILRQQKTAFLLPFCSYPVP